MINDFELAKKICDCVSDEYDDEETRKEDENRLLAEIELLEKKQLYQSGTGVSL